MSDKTIGVKVSEELHDKVKSMIQDYNMGKFHHFRKMVGVILWNKAIFMMLYPCTFFY